MADLVVKKAVKELISSDGMRSSEDTIEMLDKLVKEKVTRAKKRAEENGRKTLMPYDL